MKKIISVILLFSMLIVPMLYSCNDSDQQTEDSKTVSKSESNASGTESEGFPLEQKTFNKTIKIASASRHTFGKLQFVPEPADETQYTSINEKIISRNSLIESKYGIKIEIIEDKSPGKTLRENINSGTLEFDLVSDSVNNMLPGVQEKCYRTLDDALHLDQEWYDKNAIDNLSIGNKTFFVAGDMLITDDDNTYLCLYNKKMYADNPQLKSKHGDIYKMVYDKKWTYDKFYEMCKAVSQPDENGKWSNENCIYGNISEGYVTAIWVNGAGVRTVEKTADDKLMLNVASDRSTMAFEKVFQIMSDKTNTIRVEEFTDGTGWAKTMDMFINNKGLFMGATVASLMTIRNSAVEDKVQYGVLPVPKLDENQEKYYNGINSYQSTVMGIPITNQENFEATAYLIELLGYYNEGVNRAYYDATLKLQALSDTEDSDMLDFIFNNRLYDLGAIFDWGGKLIGIYSTVMRSGSNTLISEFESVRDLVQEKMDETIAAYSGLFN